MLELPEIFNLSNQIRKEFCDLRIIKVERGNVLHKWVSYGLDKEEYEDVLTNNRISSSFHHGRWIYLKLVSGHTLLVGELGGSIQLYSYKVKLPEKRHLTIWFEKGKILNVSIVGWAGLQVMTEQELSEHKYAGAGKSPLEHDFTLQYFTQLVKNWNGPPAKSVKALLISSPDICGIGNGYVQDILFLAGIHPKRKTQDLKDVEINQLFDAVLSVLNSAIQLGGRSEEKDLYGNPGGYKRILDSKMKDEPCPNCKAPIEAIKYLGGSSYFCPSCQKLPE